VWPVNPGETGWRGQDVETILNGAGRGRAVFATR
jgi:hypothetical protein